MTKYKIKALINKKWLGIAAVALAVVTIPLNPVSAKVSLDELLKGLPERKVTFDVVLRYALQSNRFKAVATGITSSLATELRSEAPLDFKITAKLQANRELSKPQSLLSPSEIATQSTSLGFNKAFQSGTTLGAEWINKKVNTSFSGGATGNPLFDSLIRDRSEYVPELSFTLKQDLLKNSFGRATRASLTAAEKQVEIQKLQFREVLKDWYFDLLKTFYGAWLAQEQLRHADNDVQRQQRLFRVSDSRYKSGNTELADFLQIKVALNLAEQRKLVAKQRLISVWRDVVVQLELPTTWLEIDPVDIPVELDDPTSLAADHCQKGWVEKDHSGLKVAKLEYEGSEAQLMAAKSRLLPDLFMVATLKRGSRNESSADAVNEVEKGTYPTTFYGVQLDWSLDSSAEKAQKIEAEGLRKKAEALLVVKQGILQSGWQSQCESFLRLEEYQKQLQIALKDQMQRLDLEEKRFRDGRALLFQVVQAQGDLQSTVGLEIQNETELRLTAWQAVRQSSHLEVMIDRLFQDFN